MKIFKKLKNKITNDINEMKNFISTMREFYKMIKAVDEEIKNDK